MRACARASTKVCVRAGAANPPSRGCVYCTLQHWPEALQPSPVAFGGGVQVVGHQIAQRVAAREGAAAVDHFHPGRLCTSVLRQLGVEHIQPALQDTLVLGLLVEPRQLRVQEHLDAREGPTDGLDHGSDPASCLRRRHERRSDVVGADQHKEDLRPAQRRQNLPQRVERVLRLVHGPGHDHGPVPQGEVGPGPSGVALLTPVAFVASHVLRDRVTDPDDVATATAVLGCAGALLLDALVEARGRPLLRLGGVRHRRCGVGRCTRCRAGSCISLCLGLI
mmetsp:Transcript_106715/g.334757  ORF Transcript_106715/g.334757 Transcript_106715/m.334757 type:complete len:279 (-) Transcript_106715:255-1091(-)